MSAVDAQPIRRFGRLQKLLLPVVAFALCIAIGAVYAFVVNWIPVVYFRFLATIAAGVALGTLVGKVGHRLEICNRRRMTLAGCLAGLIGVYAAWAFDGMARFGIDVFPGIMLTPTQIGGYMGAFSNDSFWGVQNPSRPSDVTNISGAFLLLIWVVEIVIIIGGCIAFAVDVRRHRYLRFASVFRTELPLLRRELTELANRRRTYLVRVVGACVLLFFVFLAYQSAMADRDQLIRIYGGFVGPSTYLGIGGAVFAAITPMLFYTIQLLMPALCCAAVTAEKENNTIGTLLLTKLSPGTIILEKVGSRVVPMLTILLLAFPVLAHVHSLGGVDTDQLVGTIWLLLSECFLIASISILFSSWFSTTTAAFIWSYAFIGLLLSFSMSLDISTFLPSAIWRDAFSGSDQYATPAQVAMLRNMGVTPPGMGTVSGWSEVFRESFTAWLAIGFFLLLARLCIVRRAFVSQASLMLKAFRVVDTFFKSLNQATTGGIEVVKDGNPLPENDPVAWRERTKKSLGKARYLFRILIVLEVPTLFICMLAATISARSAFTGLYVLECLIWTLAGLIAAVKAATLFSSERAKETIEPLLASPMTAVEILNQKVSGIRRLLVVLSVPILTVNATHFMLHFDVSSGRNVLDSIIIAGYGLLAAGSAIAIVYLIIGTSVEKRLSVLMRFLIGTVAFAILFWSGQLFFSEEGAAATSIRYLLLSLATVFILLYLIAWVATGIGLLIHSQTKAVLTSVGVIAAWVVLPLVIADASDLPSPEREVVVSFSPYSLVEANERYLTGAMLFGSGWSYSDDLGKYWWLTTHSCFSLFILVFWGLIRTWMPGLLSRRENKTVPYARMPASGVTMLEGSK